MSKVSRSKKYIYDSRIFMTEPPDDEKLLKKLFCGRDQELHQAFETLKHNMDRKGTRTAKRPWVIVGESRSGKSHLARYVVHRIDRHYRGRTCCITVSARERLKSYAVVKNLFERLRRLYQDLRYSEHFQPESLPSPINNHVIHVLAMTDGVIDRVTAFLEEKTDVLELSLSDAQTTTLQAQGTFSIIPKVLKLLIGWSRSTQHTEGQKIAFRSPSSDDLIDYCAMILDTLFWAKLLDHALILVDDIDLLEGYVNPSQNGQIERNELTNRLLSLHDLPRIDVLFTARSWYGKRHKELEVLVDLATAEPLTADILKEIHNRHFAEFVGRKKLPKEFLEQAALHDLAGLVDSLPGVFLQILKDAFQAYKSEPDEGIRGYDWLIDVYQKKLKFLHSHTPETAMAIERACISGELSVEVRDQNLFHHTPAMDVFVFQSYYSETKCFIPPFVRDVINRNLPSPPKASEDEEVS